MKALVTGAAGFIGSNLSDRLLQEGCSVRGVDCFTPYYDPVQKRDNLRDAASQRGFELIEADLFSADLVQILDQVDVVYHLAGQPGVRLSWATGFDEYVRQNVQVTQRLLEACRQTTVNRFVYASSSSAYGEPDNVPTPESSMTRPFSPYGVTKLAGELLCSAYAENFGIPTTSLRYFTVYGPRQRPDMALHRMIEAGIVGDPFVLYGDGEQIRDFTFVDDVIQATIRAGTTDLPAGTMVNVAGGGSTTMAELVSIVKEALNRDLRIQRQDPQAGDVRATGGMIEKARELLGWEPKVGLEEGVRRQVQWHRRRTRSS